MQLNGLFVLYTNKNKGVFLKIYFPRLEKKLGEAANEISPAPVQAFILPIATHNLFDEARLSKNFNELIDSSIEVS